MVSAMVMGVNNPNRVSVWNRDDDDLVRKVARNSVVKKWELLKKCKECIDEQEECISKLNEKELSKECVRWEENERKKYVEWKARNAKYMSLKERTKKENVKVGAFENFCKEKGIERKKGMWEIEAEKEIKDYEDATKEITSERKLAKSKKRRLELYRNSRKKITS